MSTAGFATSARVKWGRLKAFARANRKGQTKAEALLWAELRRARLGVSFRRQHAIGPCIVDFVCLARQLVVEVDGSSHIARDAQDRERESYLRACGFEVLRFSNTQVSQAMPVVLASIQRACSAEPTSVLPTSPPGACPEPVEGEGGSEYRPITEG